MAVTQTCLTDGEKMPPNQFLVPLDNAEVSRLVAGAGGHSRLVRESANAQLMKIAGLLGVEVA